MQNKIATSLSELDELTILLLFNASLMNNYFLRHFKDKVFRYILLLKNLNTYLQEKRDYNKYFLAGNNLALISKRVIRELR
ncbi:MAG: hypothetical protein ACI83B_001475 [Sediminicola sp.]|jgi:hypothetical protein|tara:strand:- start:1042 stop:1284 length:243 start_codon:yes stop_codon:yes gene_type:complete